ncbi:MAG: hypothetical protein GX446_04760 [Chthonomonadales bacterium]|nr:hypothetical protein [Chthonomonadales bacterium]
MDPISGLVAILAAILGRSVLLLVQAQGARLGLRASEKLEETIRDWRPRSDARRR